MDSPFSVSDERLKRLLDAYKQWRRENEDEQGYIDRHRERDENLQETLLNEDFLTTSSQNELYEEVHTYSRTLTGPAFIHLGEDRLTNELDNVKRNLLYLLESDDDPYQKAVRILEGDYRISHFAKAFWTPLFQALFPNELPHWNNKTADFMKQTLVDGFGASGDIEEQYRRISGAFKYLIELDPDQDFHTLDHFMHYCTAVDEGKRLLIEIDENGPEPPPPPAGIKKEDVLAAIFMTETKFDRILRLLTNSRKRQLILQGPPGTGKTFIANQLARFLAQSEHRIEHIQFHPSYSYEDFIEGFRPTEEGTFTRQDGIFKSFCQTAQSDPDNKYVFIIDEINRGNLSKIFGELMYLLEYRHEEVKLTYSKTPFSIPANVYLLGTMNTADRSLAIMDYALRRRFHFVTHPPQLERLAIWLRENGCQIDIGQLIAAIEEMNERIAEEMLSKNYAIGHSYFMKPHLDRTKLQDVIDFEIRPLLEEYYIDKEGQVDDVLSGFGQFE